MVTPPPRIVIVGASLVGLTLALACATRGIPVHVVERSTRRVQGGDSLTVDLSMLATTVNHDPREHPQLPVVPAYRDLTTWPALYTWLYDLAIATPGILIEEGRNVSSVTEDGDHASVTFTDGTELNADAVIGADGYHSIVRRAIAPDNPFARYAGYVVWRGLIEENRLKRAVPWPSNGGLWIEFVKGYRLVAAVVPGRDGSLVVGHRQITFAWFDVHRDSLLRHTERLTTDGSVVGTIGRGRVDHDVRAELLELVPEVWPAMWAEAVTLGIRSNDAMSGAPIAEYVPHRLTRGPLAIVGDAAHAMSPMTGRGFATGVEDALMLSRLLAEQATGEPIGATLSRYDRARLPFTRGLVTHSRRLSADYVNYAFRSEIG